MGRGLTRPTVDPNQQQRLLGHGLFGKHLAIDESVHGAQFWIRASPCPEVAQSCIRGVLVHLP